MLFIFTWTCPLRTQIYFPVFPHQIRILLSKEADATNLRSGLQNQSTNQLVNQPTNLQPTNQSVNQPPSQSMNDLIVILHYLQEKTRDKRKKIFLKIKCVSPEFDIIDKLLMTGHASNRFFFLFWFPHEHREIITSGN